MRAGERRPRRAAAGPGFLVLATWLIVLLFYPVGEARAEVDDVSAEEVLRMEIEDLLDLDVTSITRKQGKLFETAAAITVVTGDDLQRSGHTTIAETLRLVPGFHVGQIDSNKWAIGNRGWTGQFNNKLLVLADGRSVYSPLFGGVFWDTLDTFLPDLERVEVIRGPGATLWGANSMSGVVNRDSFQDLTK